MTKEFALIVLGIVFSIGNVAIGFLHASPANVIMGGLLAGRTLNLGWGVIKARIDGK